MSSVVVLLLPSASVMSNLGVGEGVGNGDGNGQSVLLVAWATRNSGNFNAGRVVNASSADQLEQTGRYHAPQLRDGIQSLVPEATVKTSWSYASGDMAGNLENGAAALGHCQWLKGWS